MKKLITLTLLLSTLLASLAGCSKANGGDETSDSIAQTTEADTETKIVIDPDVWHFENPLDRDWGEIPEVPEKYKNYAVKVPETYKQDFKEVSVNIDFFQEYYLFGSFIQVRVTVTNNTNTDMEYAYNRFGRLEISSNVDAQYSWPINLQEQLDRSIDASIQKTLKPKESAVFEEIFMADPEFFTEAVVYYFSCRFGDFSKYADLIIIPIEIVDLGK